ncbi:MAG: protein kinase [Planctomycetes bacterium]|nr:protein kinase [Planctomycetota bacterium]
MTSPALSILVAGAPAGLDLATTLAPLGRVEVHEPRAALVAVARGARPTTVLLHGGGGLGVLDLLRGLSGLLGPAVPPAIALLEPYEERLMAPVLEAGAADAVLLPFRPADLLARVRARSRAQPGATPQPRVLRAEAFDRAPQRPLTDEGGWLFGPRVLVADLGRGGLARVLKGVRLDDGSLAAVKLLDPQVAAQDEDWSKRFAREQRILKGIEDEHLVRIRDVGTLDGVPYLDMDFFAGETLDQLIARTGALPEDRALDIAAQVARGLEALHARRIVHRDVKPENVLVDEGGRVRLCDFGLSKPQDDAALTHEGEILGTAVFIAPELLRGEAPSPLSDVYALGVTLFEMLTGEDAIEPGPTQAMFQAAIRGEAQRRALQLAPDRLRGVVSRTLAVNPADRYSCMGDLVRELERLRQQKGASRRVPRP